MGPTLASLYLSFTNFDLLTPPHWIGLENYVYMFTLDPRFWQALEVTFTYVLWSVPLKLIVALALAMLLDKGIRGVGLYRALFYLPSLLGASVAVAVLWRQLFERDGIVNQLLALVGYQGEAWLHHPDYALYTLVILAVWQFGSPMVIFLAGLRQIPTDLYEAASMDGAGKVRQFLQITLPLLAPVIFFNLVLQTIEAFKAFTQAFIVSGGTGGPIDCDAVLHALPLRGGLRQFPHGLCRGAGLGAARDHRHLHRARLPDLEATGSTTKTSILRRCARPAAQARRARERRERPPRAAQARLPDPRLVRHALPAALDGRLARSSPRT